MLEFNVCAVRVYMHSIRLSVNNWFGFLAFRNEISFHVDVPREWKFNYNHIWCTTITQGDSDISPWRQANWFDDRLM